MLLVGVRVGGPFDALLYTLHMQTHNVIEEIKKIKKKKLKIKTIEICNNAIQYLCIHY